MAGNQGFMVDLKALSDATHQVAAHREDMAAAIDELRQTFNTVGLSWQSPAGTSFESTTEHFNTVADHFMSVMDDAIGRMRGTENQYLSVEAANTGNLQ
jgi:uncharacterized protein YukE